ncbi:MAG: universal stress protein [Ginsengibacter sp.]|jgi:nucleotide-binding universal stress UspA family protein
MQRILVPTDFSKNALKAVTYASEIAQKSGATIFLLHVVEPDINMIKLTGDSYRDDIVKERLEQLHESQKLVTHIYPGTKVEIQLTWGATIASILDFAEDEKMDLIVMGTTGASGLKEFFMGSVAAGTISKTKIPVLTVPVSYEMEEPDAILLTTNQFEKNKDLLDKVVAISKLFSAAIHVVIFKDTDGDVNADYIYNEEQLNDYLRFLKETFPGIIFKGEVLEGKDFEITIDRYNDKNEVDIVAMITYPKTFFDRILRKSVTKKMAFHSTIPILAIPAII